MLRGICRTGVFVMALGGMHVLADDVPVYKDASAPFEKRVADLVGRMTLQEKADQVQYVTLENKRLGIPPCCWWTEAIHGIGRAGPATIFPQAIGMAAAWDPELMHDVGEVTADEAREKYDPRGSRYRGIIIWAPTINMARDPRWGRTEETFGEDPYLTSRLAVNFVKGLQGDDPKYLKTVATPKHFAMNNQENGRTHISPAVPETVLRDYYLPAFQACFEEGKAASVMAAHNGINGTPCTANPWLLTEVLRNEWGFDGAVVTDWHAVDYLFTDHHFVKSREEACAAAINAGVDVISDPKSYPDVANAVVTAVKAGLLKEETLNQAVSRNLLVRFRLGMFDPPASLPFIYGPKDRVGSKEHVALALKAAQESMVLLKNDAAPKGYGFDGPLLPLDPRRIDSVALVGPYANQNYFGAYSADSPAGGALTMLAALTQALGDRIAVRTADWNSPEDCARAAADSSIAIVALGLDGKIENEGFDRGSILLPPAQQNLLERVVRANPLTIVALEGGSPIGLAWAKEHVPAIMMAWYPGQQGANAVAQVLLGEVNPSGRLPVTFYRANDDLLAMGDYDITKGRTYMYLEKPPCYEFGAGMSYTDFEYRNVHVDEDGAASDGKIVVSLDVANTGRYDGDEVVQVYVREKSPPAGVKRPLKQLKAFTRAEVPRGQSRPVSVSVPVSSLGFWDVNAKEYRVDPGEYEVMVGASSEDIRARVDVAIP